MYKYSILTFIIGKNYEKVHEIIDKQDDVEYILVTDDKDLKSDTWNIMYDEDLMQYKTPFERCFRIRYNVFKYCSTDTCITIDGSMLVKGSLDKLVDKFNSEHYDICLMPHPLWNDMATEYNAWIKMRGYPKSQAQHAIDFLCKAKYDFSYKGLYLLCFTIKRKTYLTKQIDDMTFAALQYLSSEDSFERLDLTIFSYVINTYFNDIKILPVSELVVRSYAIQWFWHNSNNENNNIFYDINKADKKYVLNTEVKCIYLI